MSTKIKAKQNKNQKSNPNRGFYIAISVMVAVILAIAVYFICDGFFGDNKGTDYMQNQEETGYAAPDLSDAKKVMFTMTDGQSFTMEVYPDVAPVTVENFLSLVNDGFYSGLTFHRVIPGFMAQGGAYDPVNQGNNPVDSIYGEFSSNGFENNLRHERGVVSMARTPDPNSASSQFFICYEAVPHLDGEYAAFGRVIEGMETVDSFYSEGTDEFDVPLKEVIIKEAVVIE